MRRSKRLTFHCNSGGLLKTQLALLLRGLGLLYWCINVKKCCILSNFSVRLTNISYKKCYEHFELTSIHEFVINCFHANLIKKSASLSAGFEPAREDPNGFQVHRLNHPATTTLIYYTIIHGHVKFMIILKT